MERKEQMYSQHHWFKTWTLTVAILGLLTALTVGHASAGSSAARSRSAPRAAQPTVYMVGSVTNNTFWAAVKAGFEQGGKAFNLHAIYEAPNVHSSSTAIPLIQAAIAAAPAGVAIDYSDKSQQAVTLQALAAGIKVILFNNNRFEAAGGNMANATTDPRITGLPYVGENSLVNAERLGEAFVKHLKGGTTVLIVDPVPGVEVLALRRQGIETVMHAHGIKTQYLPAALDEGKNLATIGAYLQAHPEIGGVVGLGDPTGNPAALYVQRHSLSIPVAAFDVDQEAIRWIEQGVMSDATDQQPYLQGYLSALNLSLMIYDHLYPLTINTGSYIVDKSNVSEVAKAVALGKG